MRQTDECLEFDLAAGSERSVDEAIERLDIRLRGSSRGALLLAIDELKRCVTRVT
jgi:hypothetical protein